MTSAGNANALRLGDYGRLVRRHWLPLVICLVTGIAGAVAYLHWAPKQYESTTAVLVMPVSDGSPNATPRSSDINLDTEAQLVTSTQTVTSSAQRLHLPVSNDLLNQVTVSVPPNSDILDITFSAGTPQAAQAGALAFAQSYLDQRKQAATNLLNATDKALQARIDATTVQLQNVLKSGSSLAPNSTQKFRNDAEASALNGQLAALGSQQTSVRATDVSAGQIVTEPALPSSPSSPNRLITLVAGIALGLLAGLGLALLRQRSDDVLRAPEDLFRRTRVPVAAMLSTRLHGGQVVVVPPLSADGRAYARLRNLVTTGLAQTTRRVVVVAGVRHGGGPVAANLAVSLARAGEEVFLVCADVFGGTTAALLGGQPRSGLAEVLAGEADATTAAVTVTGIPNLRVLGAGQDPDRADALLQTQGPRKLIEDLLNTASYVVVEAPATADSPDAQTLANVAELAVVVVELGQTRASEVLDACAQFESMGTPVLGGVVARYGRDVHRDSDASEDSLANEDAPVGAPSTVELAAEHVRTTAPENVDASSESAGGIRPTVADQAPVTPTGAPNNSTR